MEPLSETRALRLVAVICLIAVTAFVCALLLSLRATVVSLPKQFAGFTSAVFGEVHQARTGLLYEVDKHATGIRADTMARVDVLGETVDKRAWDVFKVVDSARQDGTKIAAAALMEIDQAREDMTAQMTAFNYTAHSAVVHANGLMDTYSDLPGNLAQSQAWLAIEPEITCRHADGTGYGGCWHSRVTGLFGEAEKVGGVFTQQFPTLATSINGIAQDAHGWTAKYVQPHPMHTRDYFEAAGKITVGLGTAALRGGIF